MNTFEKIYELQNLINEEEELKRILKEYFPSDKPFQKALIRLNQIKKEKEKYYPSNPEEAKEMGQC